jgi:hypothetical protein
MYWASASALRGERRTEHRRATTALHDRAIRRRDQTVDETRVYRAIVDGS